MKLNNYEENLKIIRLVLIEETFLRRLAYVKSLFNLAKNQYNQFSDIEVSRSIVSLDSCVEAYLWSILEKKSPDIINSLYKKSFYDVLREVNKLVSKLNMSAINDIHKTRNAIQHNGFLIAKSQATRHFLIVEQFFESTCKKIFKIPWNDVSLSALIIDEDIRSLYQKAEQEFVKKKYQDSAKFLLMALENAKDTRQLSQAGSMITLARGMAEGSDNNNDYKNLFEYTEKIEQELEVLKLGLEYSKWLGYRRDLGDVNPMISLYDSDKKILIDEKKMYLFKEDNDTIRLWVVRNLDFVLETILMWESSILNLIGLYD